jgi:hypothetical protein
LMSILLRHGESMEELMRRLSPKRVAGTSRDA